MEPSFPCRSITRGRQHSEEESQEQHSMGSGWGRAGSSGQSGVSWVQSLDGSAACAQALIPGLVHYCAQGTRRWTVLWRQEDHVEDPDIWGESG